MFRKRKNPTPGFRMPPPFHPMSGVNAPLQMSGVFPYSAIVQVAKEDTEDNYVICRGFDPRISKFIDYAEGDENKPGIPVAKPYGKRRPGLYSVAQVYQALLPLQTTNPSPTDVDWRVRQNPGYAVGGNGHPYSLSEKIDELYTTEGKLINYMLIDEGGGVDATTTIAFTCLTDRTREQSESGLAFGRSQVVITDKLGFSGDDIGETVTALFGDKRWLGTVTGCQGLAYYQYDAARAAELEEGSGSELDPWFWVVFECQELCAGFWFTTLEDRVGTDDQDVEVEVLQLCGHANADYPPQEWGGQPDEEAEPDPEDPDADPPRILTVRYRADTFPRMIEGAIGYAEFDNDILNTDDNTTMRYYVTVSQELVDEISGVLTQNPCKVDFSAYSVQNDSDWPHNQDIPASMLPLTIKNTRHAGMSGASWAATWSKAEQAYVCIDMEKIIVEVAVKLAATYAEGCTTIGGKSREVYVEACDDTETPFSLFSFKSSLAKFVDELEFGKGEAGSGSGSGAECNPILRLKWFYQVVLTPCDAEPVAGEDEIQLTTKNVVAGFVTDAQGCLVPVYAELIVFGQCGGDFNGDAILCVSPFVCPPDGSGSGSGSGSG